jgi:hypothetical protein
MSANSSNKVVSIWTVQMAQWRRAKSQGLFFLDITAKSGVRAFAPDFSRVMEYKKGLLTQEAYTQLYLERMALSREKRPETWEKLKDNEKVALACYCPAGRFCHRHLFSKLMQDYLVDQGYEARLMGEVTPSGIN